jgi:hypothetical protein
MNGWHCVAGLLMVTGVVVWSCAAGSDTSAGVPGTTGGSGGHAASSTGAGGAGASSTAGFGGWAQGGSDEGGQYPLYLLNGRTYDEQQDYMVWEGPVSFVMLEHKDGTSFQGDGGLISCADGCTEQVTRIESGGSVWGRFKNLQGFRMQAAYVGNEEGVGTVVVEACGQTVGSWPLDSTSIGLPGFVNLPPAVPSWPVPTPDKCIWTISATGGFVYFRALDAGEIGQPPLE